MFVCSNSKKSSFSEKRLNFQQNNKQWGNIVPNGLLRSVRWCLHWLQLLLFLLRATGIVTLFNFYPYLTPLDDPFPIGQFGFFIKFVRKFLNQSKILSLFGAQVYSWDLQFFVPKISIWKKGEHFDNSCCVDFYRRRGIRH